MHFAEQANPRPGRVEEGDSISQFILMPAQRIKMSQRHWRAVRAHLGEHGSTDTQVAPMLEQASQSCSGGDVTSPPGKVSCV